MPDPIHWPDWAARIEQLNRELEIALGAKEWDRIGVIQGEKDELFKALEESLPDRVDRESSTHVMLSRLAVQEEALGRLLTQAREALGKELGKTSAASSLSRRFKASYGAKDPMNPYWEHFS